MLERYTEFVQGHPRLSAGASVLGLGTAVLGASSIPEDVENWGKVFAAVGGDDIQWLLVILGLGILVAAAGPWLARGKRVALPGDSHPPERGVFPPPAAHELGARQGYPVERHGAVVGTAADLHPSSGGRIYGSDAIQQAVFRNARREDRITVEAELVTMIEEGKKICEEEFTRDLRWGPYYHWRQGLMEFIGTVFGDAERQRFIEVKATGPKPKDHVLPILEWLRERRDHPESWALKVGGEDLAAATAKRYEGDTTDEATADEGAIKASHTSPSGTEGLKGLADQLDALMREGMELLDELMAPAQAEETGKGVWALEFGDAPREWSDKADAFYKRIRDLLVAQHPALIPDLERGFNDRLRKQREAGKVPQRPGKRSTAETMLDFATDTQRTPAKVVEACLEGLSYARKAI